MQNLLKPTLVDWLGLDQSFIDSNLDVQVTIPDNCANVEQPCATLSLDCLEISESGKMECLSPCDEASLVSTCGTHAVYFEDKNLFSTFFYYRLARRKLMRFLQTNIRRQFASVTAIIGGDQTTE